MGRCSRSFVVEGGSVKAESEIKKQDLLMV